MPVVEIDGVEYTVSHAVSGARVVIQFEGTYVFADRSDDGTWAVSPDPIDPPWEVVS